MLLLKAMPRDTARKDMIFKNLFKSIVNKVCDNDFTFGNIEQITKVD